jgi:hypothetical protein
MKNILFLVIALITLYSCHHNKLKTDEKKLAERILDQEKKKNEPSELNRASKKSGSLKLRENRSVDRMKPPLVIDIAGNLDHIKELMLSDVASEITYIRMEPVPDSAIPRDLKFRYMLMDNYIIALNMYGIHLYSKEGRYIRSIVKNEITNYKVDHNMMMFWSDYTWKGGGYAVQARGNDLYYTYSNNITGEKYIMKYDCSSFSTAPEYKFDPENPDKINGLGDILIDFNHGNTIPPKPRSHQGMFSASSEVFYKDIQSSLLNDGSYAVLGRRNKLLTIFNTDGDTLSDFERYERLVNYSKSMMRGTDEGTSYEYDGTFYYRPEFNDTVFRTVPPNHIVPVYVLKLDKYKVSMQDGVDPDFDLQGRIIPGDWAETPQHIYLTYTKDNYDCPNTRKKKTVKIYHALYTKADRSLFVVKGDPFDYSAEILENNIDGGIPVWPLSYMIGYKGEMMISLKGEELKARISSGAFRNSPAPAEKKKDLEKFAKTLSEKDDILMIIK